MSSAPLPPATDAGRPDESAAPALAPDATARRTRALSAGLLLALVALGLAWELWLAPTGQGTWAVKVLPLLPVLPGLLRYRLYTYRWLSLLVWLYVTEGLVRATGLRDGAERVLASGQVLLALALFIACTVHIRSRLRRGREAAAAAGGPAPSAAP